MTRITIADRTVDYFGLSRAKIIDPPEQMKRLGSTLSDSEIQLLRADRVAGQEHLIAALRNASKAFTQKSNRARTLAMETLLYASGERQISKALDKLGITPKTENLVLLAITYHPSDEHELIGLAQSILGGRRRDSVLEIDSDHKLEELCRTYEITNKELQASKLSSEDTSSLVKRLILERSALLSAH